MKKRVITNIIFVLSVVIMFLFMQKIFTASNSLTEHAEMMMDGYYNEKENTVDAVVIGNSHIYRYWQGAFGWEQHGIAGLSLSTSDMPCNVFRNVGVEALKTQTPKVLVFDALAFADNHDLENNKIYYLTSNMKFSSNYLDTIKTYCDTVGIEGWDRLQYYFPVIQFHSRWKDLKKRDILKMKESYLNSCYEKKFLTRTIEKEEVVDTDIRVPIHEGREASLRELLEWCQKQDVQIEFIAVPTLLSEKRKGMINYVGDIVEEYGITFIDYNDKALFDSFGFVVEEDFQDVNHTNVVGSYKFCDVYGQHLIDTYDLPDRREDESYTSWETRSDEYFEVIQEIIEKNK